MDEAAAANLYTGLQRELKWYLLRQLGPDGWEDALNDTYVIVLQAIDGRQIREPSRVMSFAATVARRRIANAIGGLVRRRRESDIEDLIEVLPAPPRESPERRCADAERDSMLQQAIAELPDFYRNLTRRVLEGQDQVQVMTEMGITETQYRLGKNRAHNQIRQNLERLSRRPLRPIQAAA
jgi:RNA polymerase sigma factor (sigma-70 family)